MDKRLILKKGGCEKDNYCMKKSINTNKYYKPKQLKLLLEIEKIIEISDKKQANKTNFLNYLHLLSFIRITKYISKLSV